MTTIAVALGRGPGTEATRSVARKAAQLWQECEADFVLLSGRWSVSDTRTHATTEAADMKEVVTALGIPGNRILIDDWSRDTVSNMVGTKRVLDERSIDHGELIIVTIPYADKRAVYLAKKIFGKSFRITSVTSDYKFDTGAGEEAKLTRDERRFLFATRASLLLAPTGNIRVIQWILRLWHPGYQRRKVADPINLTT